eukprot:scaffold1787_cov165-Cylindrotheca_fusiformis.AAC.3
MGDEEKSLSLGRGYLRIDTFHENASIKCAMTIVAWFHPGGHDSIIDYQLTEAAEIFFWVLQMNALSDAYH